MKYSRYCWHQLRRLRRLPRHVEECIGGEFLGVRPIAIGISVRPQGGMMHIVGIDEAIQVLSPHWEAIDQHFAIENKKFMNLLRADHTTFGRVIKCHLIAETYVGGYLRNKLDLINLDDARLSFFQKVVLLPDKSAPSAILKPGLFKLNHLRNRFAHDLTADVSLDELQSMIEILEPSGRYIDQTNPLVVIERFTTLACTWLIVSPRHLEKLFARAFRNVAVSGRCESAMSNYVES